MANVIDKIIKKVNQAEGVVNTVKGIGALFEEQDLTRGAIPQDANAEQSRRESGVSLDPSVKLQAAVTSRGIEERRKKLGEEAMYYYGPVQARLNKNPLSGRNVVLTYPLDKYDELPNWIIFRSNSKFRGDLKDSERNDVNFPTLDTYDVDIALYLPDNFQNSQTVSYKQEKIMGAASALLDPDGIGGTDAAKGFFMEGGELIARDFAKINNKLAGIALNPLEEKLFDTVQFRNHTFDFEFYPESEREALEINRMIYWFKMGMLPNFGKDKKSAIFNTPNTWDIHVDGLSGGTLEGFEESVLTGVTVNYGGGQKFAVHREGTPVKTTLNLQFSETVIVTQKNYHEKIAAPIMRQQAESDITELRQEDAPSQTERKPVITKPGNRGGFSGNLPFGAGP